MLRVACFTLVCTFCMMTFALAAPDDEPAKKTSDKASACQAETFAGTYRIVSGEMDGKPISKDKMHHVKAVITKETIVTYDGDDNEVYAATYTLQPAEKACHLFMKTTKPAGKESTASGMLGFEGQQLKLIYALPQGEEPKSFKTGAMQHMFVMERISNKTDTDPEELKKPES